VTRTNLTRATDELTEAKVKPDVAPFLAEEEKAAKPAGEAPPPEPPRPAAEPLSEHELQAQADVALFFADEEEAPKATVTAAPPRPQSMVPPPPKPPPVADQCARCKRKFRGDWDRVDAFDGVICHICANKADSMMPGEAPVRSIPETNPLQREIMRQASWSIPGEQAAQQKLSEEQKRARSRQILILAAVGVVLTALVVFWPVAETPEPILAPGVETGPATALRPEHAGLLIKTIDIVARVAMQLVALYVTLTILKGLPKDEFLLNVISLAPIAVLLTVLWTLLHFLTALPTGGFIWAIVVELIALGLSAFIVDLLYDLSFSGIVLYVVVMELSVWMMAAVEQLVLGFLGMTLV
jgi:hypothetical protein